MTKKTAWPGEYLHKHAHFNHNIGSTIDRWGLSLKSWSTELWLAPLGNGVGSASIVPVVNVTKVNTRERVLCPCPQPFDSRSVCKRFNRVFALCPSPSITPKIHSWNALEALQSDLGNGRTRANLCEPHAVLIAGILGQPREARVTLPVEQTCIFTRLTWNYGLTQEKEHWSSRIRLANIKRIEHGYDIEMDGWKACWHEQYRTQSNGCSRSHSNVSLAEQSQWSAWIWFNTFQSELQTTFSVIILVQK